MTHDSEKLDQSEKSTPGLGTPNAVENERGSFLKRLNEYKEFVTIICAVCFGVWGAVEYFVTQNAFRQQIVHTQCQIIANIAKVSSQINQNQYLYMRDKLFSEIFPYQQKINQRVPLSIEEARAMQDYESSIDSLKKAAEAAAERAKVYDDALTTNNCSKLITFAE